MNEHLFLLIIEDSEEKTRLIIEALRKHGYKVDFRQVQTAVEMKVALTTNEWDCIISAYKLSQFNGLDALQIYNSRLLHTPFIFFSDIADEETISEVLKAGAHDYIPKRNIDQLVSVIKKEIQKVRSQDDRQGALDDLQRNEEKFRALVEQAPTGTFIVDNDFKLTYGNKSFCKTLGFPCDEVIGTDLRRYISPESVKSLVDFYLHRQEIESSHTRHEFKIIRKDGTTQDVELSFATFIDPSGNPQTFGHLLDITERKNTERKLTASSKNLSMRATQLQVAAEIARDATATKDLKVLLNRAADLIKDRYGFYHAGIYLIDKDRKYAVLAAAGGNTGKLLLEKKHRLELDDNYLICYVARKGIFRLVSNVQKNQTFEFNPSLPSTRSELALPLKIGEQIIGVLDVQSQEEGTFNEDNMQVLQIMADQLAIAIDNVSLINETQRRTHELSGLYEVALKTSGVLNAETLLTILNDQVQKLIKPDAFSITLFNEETKETRVSTAMESVETSIKSGNLGLPHENGELIEWVMRNRKPLLINDMQAEKLPATVKLGDKQKIGSWLGAPLISNNHLIGALSVLSFQPNAFDEEHLSFLKALGTQSAIALENARLFDSERRRRKEAETLGEITSALLSTLETDKVIRLILERLQDVIAYDSALVQIIQGDLLILRAVEGDVIPDTAGYAYTISSHPFIQPIIYEGKTYVFGDIQSLEGWKNIPGEENIHSWIGVPLINKDRCIGLLSIGNQKKTFYTEANSKTALTFANQAAMAIENARLFEAEQAAREQAEALRDVAETVSGKLNLEQSIQLILKQLKRMIAFDTASVVLFDEKNRTNFIAGIGYQDEKFTRQEASVLLRDSPILKDMLKQLQPVIVSDVREDPKWIWVPGAEDVRSFLGVPIIARGKMIGAVMVDSFLVNYFSKKDIEPVQALAHHMAIVIENIRLLKAERAQLALSRSLQQVGMLLTSELGLDKVLEHILDCLGQVVEFDSVSIQLPKPDNTFYLAAGRGFPDFEVADKIIENLSYDLIKKRFINKNAYVIKDTQNDSEWLGIEGTEYVRSWIGAPLIVRGQIIGILNVDSKTPNAYNENIGDTVLAFASQAAIAIENARLFESEHNARERAEALREAAHVIGSTLSLDQIINTVLEQLAHVLPFDSGNVMFIEGADVNMRAGFGYDSYIDPSHLHNISLNIDNKIIQELITTKKPVVILDTQQSPYWESTPISEHVRSWLGAPLLIRDQTTGFLGIDRIEPGGFNNDEIALVQAFAAHTSAAIENARIFQTEEKRVIALEKLREVNLKLTTSLDQKAVLDAILEGIFQLIPAALDAHIFFYKNDQLTFGAAVWQHRKQDKPISEPRENGLTYKVARSGETIVISDLHNHPLFDEIATQKGWQGSIVSIPMKTGGCVTGVINVTSQETDAFSDSDIRLLQLLGDQAALAIENARLFEQTTIERRHLGLLYDIGKAVTTSLIPDEILKRAIKLTCKAMGASMGQACIYIPEEKFLSMRAIYKKTDTNVAEPEQNLKQNMNVGLDGWVAENRHPVNISDVREDERWRVMPNLDEDIISAMVVPLLEEDKLLGTLSVLSTEPAAFTQNQFELLQAISQQTSLALSNARRYQDINRLVDMLAAEQYRLESLIERLPIGILLLDQNYRLQIANPLGNEFMSLLTYAKIGDVIYQLGKYPITQLVAKHNDPLPVEITIERPQKRTFETQIHPLDNDRKQWVLLMRDVTQERKIQDHIQKQDRLATVGQLAAGIAHDFNNIMATITVYIDLLKMDANLTSESEERIETIQQQVQRASSLIRQILDFSRRSVMEPSPLDLLPFIKEIKEILDRTLPETIRVELSYEYDQYLVTADPTRLQQVFMNLAVNARDAMEKSGTLRFELAHVKFRKDDIPPSPDITPGEWIRISVSDTGRGIPPELTSRIFEPFFTTKPVDKGTGLGLAQVYGIIKQHDGVITFDTQVGRGTTFHIFLPKLRGSSTPKKYISSLGDMDGKGKMVLIVEDDASTRKALRTLLEAQHYNVILALNGKVALDQLERYNKSIFLIISDLVMPQMDGIDLYNQIKERWRDTKILFVTGHPLGKDAQALLEKGRVHWLQKPFTIDDFNAVLQTIVKSN
ncbi:MAG: GAF domain-containing protein [Anaerolineales bacterium]|nr:GAF domain-containing protein [Anaerolineales bacterium]